MSKVLEGAVQASEGGKASMLFAALAHVSSSHSRHTAIPTQDLVMLSDRQTLTTVYYYFGNFVVLRITYKWKRAVCDQLRVAVLLRKVASISVVLSLWVMTPLVTVSQGWPKTVNGTNIYIIVHNSSKMK